MMHFNKKHFFTYHILILIAVGLSLKTIFIDFCIDSEYQITMAYRLVKGDVLFKTMWEAHQTSAFLCAFFIKIYLALFNTTTGIVLYLQFIGVLIDGLISYLLYRIVRSHLASQDVAFSMAWVFFIISPKDVPIAEFANMQIWFCLLLCIMIFLYHKTEKHIFLIFSALCLCGSILAYPSCLIITIGIIYFFIAGKKIKECFLFLGVCSLTGVLYLIYLLQHLTLSELFFNLKNMLSIEPTHTVNFVDKWISYSKEVLFLIITMFVTYLIAYVCAIIISKSKNYPNEIRRYLTNILFFLLTIIICLYTVLKWDSYTRCSYSLIFLVVIFIGVQYRNKLSPDEKYFYQCCNLVSSLGFLATLLLSDLELISSIPYLLIAFIVSFLPIAKAYQDLSSLLPLRKWQYLACMCGIILFTFRTAYIIKPINSPILPITSIRGIVKDGPAIGIISEYLGAYMQNESINEWNQYINPGSKIYLVGSGVDTLGYMYSDTIIAAPSVISTPGYNESISEYWKAYPEKYPDIVIVSCWYGELDPLLLENEWIMNWIEKDFNPSHSIDGKYWRYYFK